MAQGKDVELGYANRENEAVRQTLPHRQDLQHRHWLTMRESRRPEKQS